MRPSPENGAVPDGWQLVRLGDVAEIVMGQSPPGVTVFDWNGDSTVSRGLPFIQGNAEFGPNSPKPLKWCAQPAKVARVDDILISVRAPVGETNRANTKIGIGRGLAAIRFAVADARAFGWHALNHAKNALEAVTQGSTFKAIGGQDLRSLPILLPPPPEQQAIATVLDSIDEAIEHTETVIAATEQVRDSLLHELLTCGVPGWHREWKEVPGVGTIPADWNVVRLGDVAEVNTRTWDPSEGNNILYLDLTSVVMPGVLAPPRELAAKDAPSRARRRVQAGDILVSTVRPNLRGFARVTAAPVNLIASTGFAVVTATRVDGSLLYHHVMTDEFANYLEESTTGQAYPAVRAIDVANFRFAVGPLPEQQTIATLMDSIDDATDRARRERDVLQTMKGAAADALLTGRMRVSSREDKH